MEEDQTDDFFPILFLRANRDDDDAPLDNNTTVLGSFLRCGVLWTSTTYMYFKSNRCRDMAVEQQQQQHFN